MPLETFLNRLPRSYQKFPIQFPVLKPCLGPWFFDSQNPVPPAPFSQTMPNGAIVVLSGVGPMPADTLPPNFELFEVTPGVVPPCCLAQGGSTLEVVGTWGWDGGAAEYSLASILVSPNPAPVWAIRTVNGAPVVLTRATLYLIRYCTCKRPTTYGIGFLYPETLAPGDVPPLDVPALVAYLQTLGVNFTLCP